jgi:hypothetical protein
MSLKEKYPELESMSLFFEAVEGDYKQHEPMPLIVDGEILFIFGLFPISEDVKLFMRINSHVEVVFLVDTLSELLHFSELGLDDGFNDDRIHVRWKTEEMDDVRWAEEIAFFFPYERAHFFQNGLEETRFTHLKHTFLRKLVLEASVHKELIHYPMLCKNLLSNIQRISKSFDVGLWKDAFKGTPAVIAGAGPSLSGAKDQLHQMKNKALILAGGSTITALDKLGILPHLAFAIDPNSEEYDRLRTSRAFTVPLIYTNRVQKDIFRFFAAGTGYIRTETGGLFEVFMDEKLKIKDYGILKHLSEEALSVTTIALMVAIYLGCDPIFFAGVDLGLKGNKRYSGDILASWENTLHKDPLQEIKWLMEKDVIDAVAKAYPDRSFYDATGNGSTFNVVSAKTFGEKRFKEKENIAGKIENLIIDSKFDITSYQVIEHLKEVKESLDAMCRLIQAYLFEDLSETLFHYEMEENLSYKIFFRGMVFALQKPLLKKVRAEKSEHTKEDLSKSIFSKILEEGMKLSSLF